MSLSTIENTEGINIITKVTLSTSNENAAFWGTTFTQHVGKINSKGEYIIFKDDKKFFNDFKEHLIRISEPFPILKERLKHLKVSYHGEDTWENAVMKQFLDHNEEIYFCDHDH